MSGGIMPRRYTSGQFARFCHTTKETLFHYDRLGLLRPRHTGANGYRYYDARQFLRFDMINLFRETGTPLRDIGRCLDSAADEEIVRLLEEKLAQLRREQQRLARREALVQDMLRVTHEARNTPPDTLLVRDMPAATLEMRPVTSHDLTDVDGMVHASALFMEFYHSSERSPGMPVGILYEAEAFLDRDFRRGAFFAPAGEETPTEACRCLPAARCALYAHRGDWDSQLRCWRSLPDMLDAQGLRLAGPVLMLDMGSYVLAGAGEEYVMHCRMPVVSAEPAES